MLILFRPCSLMMLSYSHCKLLCNCCHINIVLFQVAQLEQQILESSERLKSAQQQFTEKQQQMEKLVRTSTNRHMIHVKYTL